MAKILICKSTNESTGQTVKYPIKHGRSNGKSIWIEREVVEMLIMWGLIEKTGSWFTIDAEVKAYVESKGLTIKEKFQGMQSIYEFLEEDEAMTKVLVNFVKENFLSK